MFPQLFHYHGFALPTYGVLAAAGLIVGLMVIVRQAAREGMDADRTWTLGIVAIFSAIAGAKLFLLIDEWGWYSQHPRDFFQLATLRAGGVFYGGLLAAIAASAWYIRRKRMPALKTCDVFAPGVALGHAIGRVGCFAAGCCYGKPTALPWGVTFTNPLAAVYSQTPLNVALHPTQLYEAAVEAANFLILSRLLRRPHRDGQVIGAYMFLYGFARFFLEFLRDDPERGSILGGALSVTQVVSAGLVVAGGVLWMRRRSQATVAAVAR